MYTHLKISEEKYSFPYSFFFSIHSHHLPCRLGIHPSLTGDCCLSSVTRTFSLPLLSEDDSDSLPMSAFLALSRDPSASKRIVMKPKNVTYRIPVYVHTWQSVQGMLMKDQPNMHYKKLLKHIVSRLLTGSPNNIKCTSTLC